MTEHAPGPRPLPAGLAVAWPDTSGMSREAAILTDCNHLVELGHATWIEPDGGASVASHEPEQPE